MKGSDVRETAVEKGDTVNIRQMALRNQAQSEEEINMHRRCRDLPKGER